MVLCMKTTVEIDDALLIRAKKRAAELRRPLRSLIQDGLRDQLAKRRAPDKTGRRRLKLPAVDGGIPKKARLDDREAMYAWLES